MRAGRRLILGVVLLAAGGLPLSSWAGPPDVALHEIAWYVHDDLVADGVGAETLSFYEDLLARPSAEAGLVLEGASRPIDTPCCAELAPMSVQIVGASGFRVN